MKASNAAPEDIKAKLLDMFDGLSGDMKKKWNKKYKEDCISWIDKVLCKLSEQRKNLQVASAEEKAEAKSLLANRDIDTLVEKLADLKQRLNDKEKKRIELWQVGSYYMFSYFLLDFVFEL
jgi:hypothetical protein